MSTDTTAPAEVKLSAVEGIKDQSRHLRGSIADELAAPTDHFSAEAMQLLKFHGSYQQEDRDARKARRKDGVGKHYMFMIRCKIPGGKLTADQYLALDDLAGRYANGTLRLTTRQSIQYHGVLKTNLRETIAGMNAALVSTLAACGDVNRNVMACPAPVKDAVHADMQLRADQLAEHLAPRTRAYHDIWLNGTRVTEDSEAEFEPIYGKVYLPRKFKTAIALPDDNCIDIRANDLGFLAIVEGGKVVGYNVMVGGGMGRTNAREDTLALLSSYMCFVTPEQVCAAAEAVVKLYRDHGNRADRKRARIKYLVHDWGVEKFRDLLAEYLPFPLVPARPVEITDIDLHLGWQPQGDGKWWLGVSVENGRIKDEGDFRLRTALREVVSRFKPAVRLTGQQDILLCEVAEADKAAIDAVFAAHGVRMATELTQVRKYSMACPAIPTCGLAITESERALPGLVEQLGATMAELGMADEPLAVRMTGCPNGCARPYNVDIGLVGRGGVKYTVFVGGNRFGTRLSFELKDSVPIDQVVPLVRPLLERFKAERRPGEGFGDWCSRHGEEAVRAMVGG